LTKPSSLRLFCRCFLPRHRTAADSPPEFSSAAPSRPNSLSPELPHLLPLLPNWIWSSPGRSPRRICPTPSRPSSASPELGPVVDSTPCRLSVQSKYGNRFSLAHWYSCARWFPMFAGLSPGTAACRHGRRTSPSIARFPCCPPCAFTLTTSPRLHRPCPTGSSPPATSPPARTRRRLSGRAMSRR
jgi:hypothetical protein